LQPASAHQAYKEVLKFSQVIVQRTAAPEQCAMRAARGVAKANAFRGTDILGAIAFIHQFNSSLKGHVDFRVCV
jgi:hypothetical protein